MSADGMEPVPVLSRRHASGSGGGRGLLFTILGEFVLPAGGAAWTSAFLEVLTRLDVDEKASRQALMRTAADGWLRSDRVGRRTRWHLTSAAQRLLREGAERIFGFGDAASSWDGQWLIVVSRVPDADRATRHHLRTRLAWAGCGTPGPGVWISPRLSNAAEVRSIFAADGLLNEAQIFVAAHDGGDLQAMARAAWDLDAIEERYAQFIADFSDPLVADPLVHVLELVHAWRRFPWIDPGLPSELLPDGWSGAKAAELFKNRYASWVAAAKLAWQDIAV
jgi:phenylacetic acid degradation operon negative regulatory protein